MDALDSNGVVHEAAGDAVCAGGRRGRRRKGREEWERVEVREGDGGRGTVEAGSEKVGLGKGWRREGVREGRGGGIPSEREREADQRA